MVVSARRWLRSSWTQTRLVSRRTTRARPGGSSSSPIVSQSPGCGLKPGSSARGPWLIHVSTTKSPPTLLASYGGHAWDVGHIDWRHNEVAVTPSEQGDGKSRWQGESVPLSASIGDGIRRVLAGTDPVGVTLSQRAASTLGQLRDEFRWVKPDTTTLATTSRGTRWFTFAGLRANKAIAAQLGHRLDSGQIDNLGIPIDSAVTLAELNTFRAGLSLTVVTPADEFSVKFGETIPDGLLEAMATSRSSDATAVGRVRDEPLSGYRG